MLYADSINFISPKKIFTNRSMLFIIDMIVKNKGINNGKQMS